MSLKEELTIKLYNTLVSFVVLLEGIFTWHSRAPSDFVRVQVFTRVTVIIQDDALRKIILLSLLLFLWRFGIATINIQRRCELRDYWAPVINQPHQSYRATWFMYFIIIEYGSEFEILTAP
jgi:hypothetical protein